MTARNGVVQLALCAISIYTMFLVWGLLQEKITTTVYKSGDDPLDPFNEDERFEYGVLLNGIQALCSCLAASLYLLYRRRGIPSQGRGLLGHLGLDVLTPTGCQQALVARGKRKANEPLRGLRKYVSPLWQQYLLVSALQSTASWLSIVALRHLSFPAITLAKSSKLVPVLLMNVLLYRRHFAAYKYVVVFLVTLGVWMFMALGKKKAVKGPKGNSVLGMTLLGIHLLLDGATNSTQDEVFETYGPLVSGTQMMLVMNAMSASYMVTALLLPEGIVTYAMTHMRMHLASWLHPHWVAQVITAGLSHPTMTWTPQVVSGVQFLLRHPDAARDVLLYALAGAAGQIAIFETLERFGSLTLVSITVTRKLFTMLLSILVYKHHLRSLQWVGVAIVFSGLFIEMRQKQRQSAAAARAKAQ
ncbi:udp-galactose transporter [Malassezia pachydermatis]|uniref:UDP-galactose transporter homolog 1 n=1 Tax=Malassezia pachydermatis TaxID=77020 RepID=A0A0M8MKK9_9BASI|nr:udp-galactose transporter [Malassezia pachydermatis]KOS14346.1 udp-galactose transporter [Malassezia pachydermatis]